MVFDGKRTFVKYLIDIDGNSYTTLPKAVFFESDKITDLTTLKTVKNRYEARGSITQEQADALREETPEHQLVLLSRVHLGKVFPTRHYLFIPKETYEVLDDYWEQTISDYSNFKPELVDNKIYEAYDAYLKRKEND
jgi:hypothetical protein